MSIENSFTSGNSQMLIHHYLHPISLLLNLVEAIFYKKTLQLEILIRDKLY